MPHPYGLRMCSFFSQPDILYIERHHPTTAMHWAPNDGRRKRGRPKKTWRSTFKEDLEEMGVMEHSGSPVTETDGDFSSPDALRGTMP